MLWHIYILLCDQKTFYVGLSSDVNKRLLSHKLKQNIATKEFSHIQLVYQEKYKTRFEAEKREKQLKGWTTAKKKALIGGDKELLIKLSKTQSMLKNAKRQ